MAILLVSATKFEVAPSIRFLQKNKIEILITGVGSPGCVYQITNAINERKPSMIIQAGIAGSFEKNISLCETFCIQSDYFGDIGVIENKKWKSVFDLGFSNPDRVPYKNGKLINPNKKILKDCGLKTANAVTVNEISTSKTKIDLFKNEHVQLESMEGAALHLAALMKKIPFLQIRSVSNYVGERNKKKWNMSGAIKSLNSAVMETSMLFL